MYKNTASQKLIVSVKDADGDLVSGDGSNITAIISKDGASTNATNDVNPTEIGTTGFYAFDLTQAETNADLILLIATTSTPDCTIEPVTIYTNNKEANLKQIDGYAVNDNLATLKLKTLDIRNSAGTGIYISGTSTGVYISGDSALYLSGENGLVANGTVNGILALGSDASAIGFLAQCTETGGTGFKAVGTSKDIDIDTISAIKTQTDKFGFTGSYVNSQIKATDDIGLSTTQKADVNSEVDNALDTAIPAHQTPGSANEALVYTLGTSTTLNSMIELDGSDSVFTSKALENTKTAVGLATANLDTQLSAIDTKTDQLAFTAGTVNANLATGGIGSGSEEVNYYVYTNESAKTGPIANVSVWITSDSAGTTVVAQGMTDSNGKAVFYLNSDTYYFWRSKTGYTFTNPDIETV